MFSEETQEALREWLRLNLKIDVEPCIKLGKNNDVNIGLRFKGEEAAFCYERVSIPDQEDA